MSSTGPALIVAAAGVGFGHAVMPDHWVPLAVLGRTRKYPVGRVARLSGMAGVAHVLVSVLLGAVIILIGLQFRSTVEHAQDEIVGGLLIVTGIAFLVLELTGHGHHHDHDHGHDHDHDHDHGHDHDHDHDHDHLPSEPGRLRGAAAVMVPFGAAASPDLTILPVFLAAAASGVGVAVGSVVAFAAVTIGTIVALTMLATFGSRQVQAPWLEEWGNVVTAIVLIAIGALIAVGAI
jgi:ABC-type nickel/cobalt efflux system permease component RcnA